LAVWEYGSNNANGGGVAVKDASDDTAAAEPPVVKKAYSTKLGAMYQAKVEDFLKSPDARKYKGNVQLIFISPPFPLVAQKTYGNKVGEAYLEWLSDLAPKLTKLLTTTGSSPKTIVPRRTDRQPADRDISWTQLNSPRLRDTS
jgi:hypothetical protein